MRRLASIPFLAFALAAAAAPLDAPLARLHRLVAAQNDQPVDTIRALDKKIESLQRQILKAGPAAAGPLAAVARAADRPLKERVWAVNFLALLADPAAYEPLSGLSLDKSQPEVVRAQALSALASTGVDAPALRRTACAALAQDDLPSEALREALLIASRTGCDDPGLPARRAKEQGPKPAREPQSLLASLSIRAVARSRAPSAAGELFTLFDFYKTGTPERALTLTVLRDDQLENLKSDTLAARRICDDFSAEARTPAAAIAALRLLVALDGAVCEPTLLRELKNPDAEVVTEDAEALAALRLDSAVKPLAKIIDGAVSDERFGPRPGRPDPVGLLDRIQRALIRLR